MSKRRSLIIHPVAQFLIAVGFTFVFSLFDYSYFEAFAYDLKVLLNPSPLPSANIALVTIGKSTIELYGEEPQVHQHQLLLDALIEAKPKAIIYVVKPDSFNGSESEKLRFVERARLQTKSPLVVHLHQGLKVKGDFSEKTFLNPPFHNFPVAQGPRTGDVAAFAKDGVTRRAIHSFDQQLMLHPLLAENENGLIGFSEKTQGLFEYRDSMQVLIRFATGYDEFQMEQLIDSSRDIKKQFKDKYIFIGKDLGIDGNDYVSTPLTRFNEQLEPLHKLHAQIFDTFQRNDALRVADPRLVWPLVFLFIWATVFAVASLKPSKGIWLLMALNASYVTVSLLAMRMWDLHLEIATVLIPAFVTYYLLLPFRLIFESRRSWEFYEKNRLLTQVEELKSNFISMMSHDLNTPLARISGMTAVLKQSPTAAEQELALSTIETSTNELVQLIKRILQYGQIESQAIKVSRKSVDLNEVIKLSVAKVKFKAQEKQIEVAPRFQELFPISIDQDLIGQVVINLLENAIKYSPSGSTVEVVTADLGESVSLTVIDQGQGIAPQDLQNVFLKFFRSQTVNISTIPGSGLGLYLARYFVELHQGQITLDSQIGKGTTVTVTLPNA